MTTVLLVGTVVGALFGVMHALYVYRLIITEAPAETPPCRARALYYALWTLGLWLLFGSYVLMLWLIGVVLYTIFKAFR